MAGGGLSWWSGVERDLPAALYEAAAGAWPAVRAVDLDLYNCEVQVRAAGLLTPETPGAIREAVRGPGAREFPAVRGWRVGVGRVPARPFTDHFDRQPQARRFHRSPEQVAVFEARTSDLLDLRGALGGIAGLVGGADVVGAFAAGGFPLLEHLAESRWEIEAPPGPWGRARALDAFAGRYHLFPGLNWEHPGNKPLFDRWLRGLPSGTDVLLFDTGRKGNGVRQAARLVRAAAATAPFGPARVRVVGVVDGYDPAQEETDEVVRGDNGRAVRLSVRYRRVPPVLPEDCAVLLGRATDREANALLPVRDVGLVRQLDDSDRPLAVTASTSASGVYRALLANPPTAGPAGGARGLYPGREREMVEAVLADAFREEEMLLNNAWAGGLVSDRCHQKERRAMPRRYLHSLNRFGRRVWCFLDKEFVDAPARAAGL